MANRVKPLRFTQAEHAFVDFALEHSLVDGARATKLLAQCRAKLAEAVSGKVDGIAAGPMEQAIIAHSRGKIAKMLTGSAYARASQMLTKLEATEQDMIDLGKWLSRQGWLTGTLTLVTVLGKWDEWLPRARAEVINRPPQGFDDEDSGPGTSGQRPTNQAGRRPGF